MTKIDQMFTCVICGDAWDNSQSLKAHMKVHKGKYRRTTYWTPIDLDDKFRKVARKHKTNTCNLIIPFVRAIVEGEETGLIDVPKILSANPIIVNLTTVYAGTPRSPYKIEIPSSLLDKNVCQRCGSRKIRMRKMIEEGFFEWSCLVCKSEGLIYDKKGV